MRKIFAIMLILALSMTCVCGSVFAAPTTDVYLGDGSLNLSATSDNVDVDIYFKAGGKFLEDKETYGDSMLLGALQINFSVTNSVYTSKAVSLSGLNGVAGENAIIYSQKEASGGNGYNYSTDAFKVGTLSIARKDGAASSVVSISGVTLLDDYATEYDATYQDTLTITWPSSTPDPEVKNVTTTADGTTFGDYKDVPLFNCGATVENATASTKIFIEPELFLDGTSHGKKAKTEIPGLTIDGEGKVVIKIAVVGAPDGVVTITPNITAE